MLCEDMHESLQKCLYQVVQEIQNGNESKTGREKQRITLRCFECMNAVLHFPEVPSNTCKLEREAGMVQI